MHTRNPSKQRTPNFLTARTGLLTTCAITLLLLAACAPVALPATTQPEATLPAATQPPSTQAAEPTPPATGAAKTEAGGILLDLTGVAQGMSAETVAAVPNDGANAWWMVAPEHSRVTLQGYIGAKHTRQPQIFVFPAAELEAYGDATAGALAGLQALIASRQPVEPMPFLPPGNDVQVLHAQARYLEFRGGSGARYLTQYNNGIAPINNGQLFYTFQGLTSDGRYYISAVLPVAHPELPATPELRDIDVANLEDFPAYKARAAQWLEEQPAASFTPDLALLDALVQSLEVR